MAARSIRLCCLLLFFGSLGVSGCRRHPLDAKIDARDDLGFALWMSAETSRLTAEDRSELHEAQKQIKLAVMSASPGLPAEEFRQAVYVEIYGHTVREVLLRDVEIRAERIGGEIKALETREEHYRAINPKLLPPASREFLEGFKARMEKRHADLQRLEERKVLLLSR